MNTMKQLIGTVTPAQRDEIKTLYERKNGLTELFKIVDVNNVSLYEKLVKDMGETATKFQKWWDEQSQTNHWEGKKDYHWEINFETCEIFLVSNGLS